MQPINGGMPVYRIRRVGRNEQGRSVELTEFTIAHAAQDFTFQQCRNHTVGDAPVKQVSAQLRIKYGIAGGYRPAQYE